MSKRPLTSTWNIQLYAVCLTVYLILAIGRVLPYDSEDLVKSVVGGVIFVLCVSYIATTKSTSRIAKNAFVFGCVSAITLALRAMTSEQPGYAFDKFHGGIISACIAYFGLAHCYQQHGIFKTHRAFMFSALGVLFLTVLYKSNAGFFDRSTRFLINGPIVFGWISGMFCIMSFQLHSATNLTRYRLAGLFFLAAILWTQSKGPLLALLIVFVYTNIPFILSNKLKTLLLGCMIAAIGISNIELIEDSLSETRFAVFTRLATGQLQDSDEGSVGVRSELIDHAISNIEAHPFTGIGLGQFEHFGFKYPHNQHLEIATELGMPVAALHLIFIGACFFFSNRHFRSFIVFFFIAGLFSGDISYLRFLYTFSLLGLISKYLPWQSPYTKRISGNKYD